LFGCTLDEQGHLPPEIVLFAPDHGVEILAPATRAKHRIFQIDTAFTLALCFRHDDSTLRFATYRADSIRSDTESVQIELFQASLTSESVHKIAEANIRLHRYDTVLLHAEYSNGHPLRDSQVDFGVRIRSCKAIDYLGELPGFHPILDEPIFKKGTNLFEHRDQDTIQLTHNSDGYNPKCVNGYGLVATHPDGERILASFRPGSNCFAPNMFSTLNILLRMIGEGPTLVSISKATGRQKTVLHGEFGEGEISPDGRYLLAPQFHPDGDGSASRFVYFDLEDGSPVAVDSAKWAFWGISTPAGPLPGEH